MTQRTLEDRVTDIIDSLAQGTSIQWAQPAVRQILDLIEPSAPAPGPAAPPPAPADEETYLINDYHSFSIVDKNNTNIANLDVVRRHGVAFLTNLQVNHAHRRKGLARKLFDQAFRYYTGEDLYLNVYGFLDRPMDDEALTAFYGRLGFEPIPGSPGAMCRKAVQKEHLYYAFDPATQDRTFVAVRAYTQDGVITLTQEDK